MVESCTHMYRSTLKLTLTVGGVESEWDHKKHIIQETDLSGSFDERQLCSTVQTVVHYKSEDIIIM